MIDVLSDSSYALEHIEGAKNFSVYEMAFLDNMRKEFPDKDAPITLYGLNDETEEAPRAKYILDASGYTAVGILKGGLEGWKKAGKPIVKGKSSTATTSLVSNRSL